MDAAPYTLHTAYYTPNQTCVVWRVNLAKSRMSRVNAASVTLEHQTADVTSQAADYKAKTYHTPRQLVHLIPNNSITHSLHKRLDILVDNRIALQKYQSLL